MSKHTDIRIVEAECTFRTIPYRTPLKFGGRTMSKTDLIEMRVTVETADGQMADGFGSMPVGNVWAWPSQTLSADETESAMKRFAEEVVLLANQYPEYGHPVDLTFNLSAEYAHMGRALPQRIGFEEPIPELAQLVAASAFDAALHDGYGRVLEANCFRLLSSEFMSYDLSEYLDEQFAGEYLDQYTLADPKPKLPLYHLVGAADPLTEGDIESRIDDGLPETLGEWIAADGLTHLKIKLAGDDPAWDLDRILTVDRIAAEAQAERGCSTWCYSLDFNEKCEDVAYLVEFLTKLKQQNAAAFDRVQYIEQPTHRDLEAHPDNRMHEAAKLKPVVIDESLVDYDSLLLAREMGYSGVALKTCKGQTESLLLAAAAQKFEMFLCVQDLTCPGFSFLQSASLAAHISTVAAIEGNGRQYCPAANKDWAKRFPGMFDISDGTVQTGSLDGIGLGF